jgi:Caspase domain
MPHDGGNTALEKHDVICSWPLFWVLAGLAGEEAATPRKLALLVAVADYPAECEALFPDLVGCVNDIELARDLLVERFGFQTSDIVMLADAAATHEAVVRAFHEHLIARAGPGTDAVFWYSGHGSRIPDLSGIEPTGHDSTFVLHDSRVVDPDGGYDLSDDELRALIDHLVARTARLLVVTDSCHSGGVTRSGSTARRPNARSVPPGTKPLARERIAGFWPPEIELGDDATIAAPRAGFVHIAACTADQIAQENPFPYPDGKYHGFLTYGLCWYLRSADPTATFRSIATKTAFWIAPLVEGQTVRCEGEIDRTILGGSFAPSPRGFAVMAGDGRELTIAGGTLHGVHARTEFVIENEAGAEIGRARAAFLGALETGALWVAEKPAGANGVALRAVVVPGTGARRPLRIRIDAADPAAAEAIATALAGRPGLAETVEADAPGSYRLDWVNGDGESRLIFADPAGRELFARRGEVATVDRFAVEVRDELFAALDSERDHQAIFALAEESGSLRVAASLAPPDPAKRRPENFALPVTRLDTAIPTYVAEVSPAETRVGEFALRVENLADKSLRIAVLAVSDDRTRTRLYPPTGVDEMLPPGKTLTIPLGMKVAGSPVRERYLVFATRERLDLEALEARTPLRGGAAPSVITRAFGIESTSTLRGGDEYGITSIDLLLRARGAN